MSNGNKNSSDGCLLFLILIVLLTMSPMCNQVKNPQPQPPVATEQQK